MKNENPDLLRVARSVKRNHDAFQEAQIQQSERARRERFNLLKDGFIKSLRPDIAELLQQSAYAIASQQRGISISIPFGPTLVIVNLEHETEQLWRLSLGTTANDTPVPAPLIEHESVLVRCEIDGVFVLQHDTYPDLTTCLFSWIAKHVPQEVQ